MVVVKFRQNLLHDGLTKKSSLGTHPEALAISIDGSHLTVIQIDDLPVLTDKRGFLFLEIFRIDCRLIMFLSFGH